MTHSNQPSANSAAPRILPVPQSTELHAPGPRGRNFFAILRSAFKQFVNNDCASMAGSLAYYAVFSLAPLLVVVIAGLGLFLDRKLVEGQLQAELQQFIGTQGAAQIQDMIRGASHRGSDSVAASAIGLGVLLFGATGFFMQLQWALNRTWGVQPDPRRGGVRNFILKRLLSLGMVLGIALLLLISLVMSAILAMLSRYVAAHLASGISGALLFSLEQAAAVVTITLLFATIFKIMPDANIRWRDVWIGGAFTAALFEGGKFAIALYLGRSSISSGYGAAGSLALVLVWVYYSSMIVLFGAEFTQAWGQARHHRAKPETGAMRVEQQTVRV